MATKTKNAKATKKVAEGAGAFRWAYCDDGALRCLRPATGSGAKLKALDNDGSWTVDVYFHGKRVDGASLTASTEDHAKRVAENLLDKFGL